MMASSNRRNCWRPRQTCRSGASRHRSSNNSRGKARRRQPLRLNSRPKRLGAASKPTWRSVYSLDSLKGVARAAIFVFTVAATSLSGSAFAYADALSRVNVGAPAPAFSAKGADGRLHRLSDYAGKLVVLEWTSPVCPFTAIKYRSGAMQALQKYAASQHVVWLSIDSAAPGKAGYLTAAAARARIAATQAAVTAILFDIDG